jgi:hypothetical protein
MVKLWYKMVISGKIELEDVPEKYRDEVAAMLEV